MINLGNRVVNNYLIPSEAGYILINAIFLILSTTIPFLLNAFVDVTHGIYTTQGQSREG